MSRPKSTKAPTLKSTQLPRFTFIDDTGAEQTIALAETVPEIRGAADYFGDRIPQGTVVGLIYRSSPELVKNWLACLLAGLRPLVMQYPTKKQTRTYWTDSVQNTISVGQVGAIICDAFCAGILRETQMPVAVIAQNEVALHGSGDATPFSLASFSILQLSSGTTGYRKAIEFHADQLFKHVRDYNAALELGGKDKIVSWLPLYHDMGYVACFVMPMILGVDVVMMDPMTWIRQPDLLFDAIERHCGTVCYLPNFGFEVMARLPGRRLPSMRWWISCSEPISYQTAQKFIEVVHADPDTFAPCYAMAENVFAVSLRRGLAARQIDEADVVSCGRPIANVDLKEVDGEIWVRSPASLTAYIGGDDIRDVDGFYPTGDLGRLIDGELFITGRKQDLLIQAGRKYMLSDIDLAVNRLFPWVRGRAAAVQAYDARLGTQKPLILIETEDFFLRRDQNEIGNAVRDAVGLDQVSVEFVPPRFLTKTSSGKFNRKKSAADWLLAQKARDAFISRPDAMAELNENFGHLDWSKPVKDILDSLSLEMLRIILSATPVRYNAAMSLSAFAARLEKPASSVAGNKDDVIRIVSLADRSNFRRLSQFDLDKLSGLLGSTVTFEHLCMPPSPIILSDLIFHDYFQGRVNDGNFAAVDSAIAALKSASAIIVDDVAEMLVGGMQCYGVLSHNLERDPNCDQISFRWQRYPKYHDTLPLAFVAGADLDFANRTAVIEMLSAYLDKPILKMATDPSLAKFTKGWDYYPNKKKKIARAGAPIDPEQFVASFAHWAKHRPKPLEKSRATGGDPLQMNDLGHFCSHFIERSFVDHIIAKFDRFCIAGQRSSVPYIRQELERQGKSYTYAASYSPEILNELTEDYDCVMICGPQGDYKIDRAAVAVMRAGGDWRTQNLDDPKIVDVPFNVPLAKTPESRTDWFYPFPLRRGENTAALLKARNALKAANIAGQDERARRIQELTERRATFQREKSARREEREERQRAHAEKTKMRQSPDQSG